MSDTPANTKDVGAAAATLDLAVRFPNGGTLSAEDIAFLEAIRAQRSILKAARAMNLSYRKGWLIVDALNRTFETPVVETFPGRRGSGSEVTAFGERLVALYRSLERLSHKAAARTLAELTGALDPAFTPRAALTPPAMDAASEVLQSAPARRGRSPRS